MKRKCVETTTKDTRCENDIFADADICKFHARRRLKELNEEFSSLQVIAKEDIRRFWLVFGTVMGSAALVFITCLIARYYFGVENLPRW